MSTCRSCPAEIIWCKTDGGRFMPVDAAPDPAGIVEVMPDPHPMAAPGDRVAIVHGQTPALVVGTLHTSHFATCPNADQWRRR